jgi:hypothetical protein
VKYIVIPIMLASALAACGDDKLSVEELMKPETCMQCHPKHYEQWSGSMHAYAAEDPVFLAMNARGQRDTNGELGDFCITCHAPMALKLGLASGASFDPDALPSLAKGVTCYFCHNVAQVIGEHNNPLELAMDQTMRGGVRDPVSNPAHHSKYDPMMASKTNKSVMCGSCHDLVTPGLGVHLERSFAEWKTTIFALDDPDPAAALPQTCSSCHMFPTDEPIADGPGLNVGVRQNGFHEHMWPAVDLALTPFPQMEEQEAAVKRDLLPAIAIKGVKPATTNEAPGGICLWQDLRLTVRIDSFSVGHMFPSGAAQDRRVWLQVEVFDASGNIIWERGRVPDGVDPEQTSDPTLTTDCDAEAKSCATFFDRTFKADGTPAHFFWDVASYKSRLIRPAITRDPNSAAYDHSTTIEYQVPLQVYQQADKIVAQIFIRPLPFALLHDLEQSGDLDPVIKTRVKTLPVGEPSVWYKATAGQPPATNTPCNPF